MVRSRNTSRKRLNKRRDTSRKNSRKSLMKRKNIRRKVLRNNGGGYPDYVQTKIDEINRIESLTLDSLCAILFGENNYAIFPDYLYWKDKYLIRPLKFLNTKKYNFYEDSKLFNELELSVELSFQEYIPLFTELGKVIKIIFRDNEPIRIMHVDQYSVERVSKYLAKKRK